MENSGIGQDLPMEKEGRNFLRWGLKTKQNEKSKQKQRQNTV